jgi:RHS repeat-associated protein
MTDDAGNVSGGAAAGQRLAYDEYGNLSSAANSTGEQFRYTGRRYDAETGLYYYRARYYSPQMGRFLQVDPVGYKDDIDLYTYVGNDPLDHTDPSGKCIEDLCIGEALAVIAFVSEALEGTGLVEGSIEAASVARATVAAGAAARVADAGVDAARAVRGGAAPVKAGEAGANVAESAANAAGYTSAGREVTASTATGTTRYDRVMKDGTQNVGVEVKTGPTAKLNTNQRTQQTATNSGAETTMRGANAQAAGLNGQAIDRAEVMHVNDGQVTAWYCVVSFLCK